MEGEVLVLSETNKRQLLSSAASLVLSEEATSTAKAILERLVQLCPDLESQIFLKKDAISDLVLRMICLPTPPPGTSIPSFIAVSYCWHSDDWTVSEVADTKSPSWLISSAMVDSIMAFRQSPGEGVWLDQLCIKQDNEDEKKITVGAMDIIYRSARRLIILLEDVTLTEHEEESALTYDGFFEDMCRESEDRGLEGQAKEVFVAGYFKSRESCLAEEAQHYPAVAHSFVVKMLGARWFSRAWCSHESRVVRQTKVNNPVLLCFGHDGRVLSFEFRFISFLAHHLFDGETDPQNMTLLDYYNDPEPVSLQQLVWRMSNIMGRGSTESQSLISHGLKVMSSKCRDLEDIVSIALNTSGIPLAFRGKVKSQCDILRIFAAISIASGDVGPLTLHGGILKLLADEVDTTTVSWMKRPYNTENDEWSQPLLANTISRVEREYIELDLYLFANLPTMATQSSMEIAAAILAEHNLERSFGGHQFGNKPPDAYIRAVDPSFQLYEELCPNFGQICLALAIDCGINWVRRFPTVLKSDPEEFLGSIGVSDSSKTWIDLAHSLLVVMGIEQSLENFEEQYLKPTTAFLSCIADRALRSLSPQPRRIQTAKGDYALTTLTTNQVWFAVPVAISQLPFWAKRVWMVEPFDPTTDVSSATPPTTTSDFVEYIPQVADAGGSSDTALIGIMSDDRGCRAARNDQRGTWRLRHTQALYGCQAIVPDGEFVFHLKRQKVYGTGMRQTDGPFYHLDGEGRLRRTM